ncbi:MAG: voltage-gated potassium channel [Flavobacteriaceae bacterium TMED212]|nr:MAG: voltage-gated potassium channel [Flavobacteriaceae bacterium TMED212]|tara:strand:- start:5710 stop:6405 length:696 start_codon:yes stop_codon:yes gene_type:complete
MRKKIDSFLDSETGLGLYFNFFIQFLIIVSVINFSILTLPNLSVKTQKILNSIEIFSVSIFTVEYLLRFYAAKSRVKFFFSFFGMIDLIAILPFYLALGLDLKSLRAIRLFRILRLFKFLRYGNTMDKIRKSFKSIKRELFLFSLATLLLLYFSSIGIYFFENQAQPEAFSSIFDAMWWSVATLTTVGYGDVYPITTGGKIFASVIVFIGLGLVAIPTGLIASSLTRAFQE